MATIINGSDNFNTANALNNDGTGRLNTAGITEDSAGRVTMPYQPAFKAYATSNTSGGLNIINSFVTNGNYGSFQVGNSLTSDRFTVPIAGRYLFSVSMLYNHGGDNNWARIWTRVNGSNVVDGLGNNGTLSYQSISYSIVLDLQENDYVQLVAEDSGQNGYAYGNNYSSWSGHLIG